MNTTPTYCPCLFVAYVRLPYAVAAYGTQHPPIAANNASLLLDTIPTYCTQYPSTAHAPPPPPPPFLYPPTAVHKPAYRCAQTRLLLCTNPPTAVHKPTYCCTQWPRTVHNTGLLLSTKPTYCTITRVSLCILSDANFSARARSGPRWQLAVSAGHPGRPDGNDKYCPYCRRHRQPQGNLTVK